MPSARCVPSDLFSDTVSEPSEPSPGNVMAVNRPTADLPIGLDELELSTSRPMRLVYAAFGFLFLGIGFLGFVVPGLPGFVFLLIALWSFSRSSQRMHHWMLTNRFFGQRLLDYKSGLGIPRRIKIVAVTCIVLAVGYSVGFAITALWLQVGLVALGLYGIYFILDKPTTEVELARRSATA